MSNKRTLEECDNFIKDYFKTHGVRPSRLTSEGANWNAWLIRAKDTSLKARCETLFKKPD